MVVGDNFMNKISFIDFMDFFEEGIKVMGNSLDYVT
jgi:hypothetical protein